jgi:hypothetical protein
LDFNNYFLQLDVLEVLHLLKALNPGKTSGPDDIPNRFLKDYAEIPAHAAGMRSFKQQLC